MATYPHQQLELTLRLNDSATKVTRRLRDDLPSHIKGVAEFVSQGGVGTGYYLPQHISKDNRLEPVEFINNSWYGLFYSAQQKAFFTRESLQIHPDNRLGLGYWNINDAHHPAFKHPSTVTQTTAGSSTSDNQPPGEDSEEEHTPVQQPHDDSEFTIAPTFPFETIESQPPPRQPNNPEDPPNDPLTTNMTNNPPTNGGGLRGTPPTVFTGDRARSDTFWNEIRRYKLLNRHNEAISNPFNRVLTVLSYIKGDRVEDWVDGQAKRLEDRIDTSRTGHIGDGDEVLWREFEIAFKSAWNDGAKTQSAYDQLKKLTMKDLDVDAYAATFNRLALTAGWEVDALGTIDKFANGLKDNVHRRVLNRETEPTTMEEWQDAARKETQKIRKLSSAGLDFRNKNKSRDTGPFHTGQNLRPIPPRTNNNQIVPMEVDATSTQSRTPFKKLTDEER